MLLTDAERARFIEWLDNEIRANQLLVDQMKKLPGPAMTEMADKFRLTNVALAVVRDLLAKTERQTL